MKLWMKDTHYLIVNGENKIEIIADTYEFENRKIIEYNNKWYEPEYNNSILRYVIDLNKPLDSVQFELYE